MLATALGILGTPVGVTSALLRIPSGDVVEKAYRDHSDEMDTIPHGIEPIAQVNMA